MSLQGRQSAQSRRCTRIQPGKNCIPLRPTRRPAQSHTSLRYSWYKRWLQRQPRCRPRRRSARMGWHTSSRLRRQCRRWSQQYSKSPMRKQSEWKRPRGSNCRRCMCCIRCCWQSRCMFLPHTVWARLSRLRSMILRDRPSAQWPLAGNRCQRRTASGCSARQWRSRIRPRTEHTLSWKWPRPACCMTPRRSWCTLCCR